MPFEGINQTSISVIDLAKAESLWRRATAKSPTYVFQCYDWLATWQATAGVAHGIQSLVVSITDPTGQPLLLLPLGIQRSFGCRYLVFLGGRASDYNAPIIIDTAWTASIDFADLWKQIIRHLPPIDVVWLERIPHVIEDFQNPMVRLPYCVPSDNAYAASPLPRSFQEYLRAHRSDDIRDTTRKRRRLAELGNVNFEVVQDEEVIRATVETMLEQEAQA